MRLIVFEPAYRRVAEELKLGNPRGYPCPRFVTGSPKALPFSRVGY